MMKSKGLFLRISLVAIILAFTIALNVVSLTIFDNLFTRYLGATESKIDTSNVEVDLENLDTMYVKSDFDNFEDFRKVLDLNLVAGCLMPSQLFSAYWRKEKRAGVILNIASMASYLPLSGACSCSNRQRAFSIFSNKIHIGYC